MKLSFFDLNFSELTNILHVNGLNTSASSLLFNWYYKKKRRDTCLDDISKKTLLFLDNNYNFDFPIVENISESQDSTVKFLFKFPDGRTVESVLIPFHNKYSLCLSSQVGCAMNCSFCFTGTQGLKRNLKTSEIMGQFLGADYWLKSNRPSERQITNIVFMGQGEPLHNFDNVKKACEILLSKNGASIGHQKITISTAGYLPGLKRWNDEIPGVNLALSLHSVVTKVRNELIPINKIYPLAEVLNYIDNISLSKKQFVTYEYLLIEGLNDSIADAFLLGELLKDKSAYINLIPFNPFPGSRYKRPPHRKVEAFKKALDSFKIPTLIRATKGDDVLAACGQLTSNFNS